ncbi:protoheme ferro-lyase [Bradyrhizobium sp. USDA 377]
MKPASRNRHQPQQLGGIISLTRVRDRTGEDGDLFSVSWHSLGGDLRWLSPTMPEEIADAAARMLANFTGGVLRR